MTHSQAHNELGPAPDELDLVQFDCGHTGHDAEGCIIGWTEHGRPRVVCMDCADSDKALEALTGPRPAQRAEGQKQRTA